MNPAAPLLLLGALTAPQELLPVAPAWARAGEFVDWFARVPVEDGEARMLELVMSGGLTDWSREWIGAALERTPPLEAWLEEAQQRRQPIFWYVPTVEGQHVILPHLLDRYVQIGVFADPLVAELLSRRFVAVQAPAAGELARRFALLPPDFVEPGYLVLSPEGEVVLSVDRAYTFEAAPHLELLRGTLQALARSARTSAGFRRAHAHWDAARSVERGLAFAREALLDGELELAAHVLAQTTELEGGGDAAVSLACARLARVRGDARAAASALDAAARAMGDGAGDGRAELHAERGLLAMRSGAWSSAQTELGLALAAGGTRRAECAYYLGAVRYLSRDEEGALAAWDEAVRADPSSPWAARASAYLAIGTDGLRGEGPLTRAMESLRRSRPPSVQHGTRAPYGVDEGDELVARALAFLLEQQRSDGSWLGARWGGGGEPAPGEEIGRGPGAFSNIHTAISALACAALAAWRDVAPGAIDAALERGDGYLLRDDLVLRGEETAWVYADAFRILHYVWRYPDPGARPDDVAAAIELWVGALMQQQDEIGSFKHYSYTSTFVTAMVTIALLEARDAGVPIPGDVFARAARVVSAARGGEQRLFGYLLDAPAVNRTLAGAACRQPLCTWMLMRCDAGGLGDVEFAIDLFLEQYARAVEPPRLSNFHMPALDGSAGYFFFHNFLATALASVDCGERRAEFRARLRECLFALPEVDGTFVDAGFSYGKGYGTAMALLSLAALEAGG